MFKFTANVSKMNGEQLFEGGPKFVYYFDVEFRDCNEDQSIKRARFLQKALGPECKVTLTKSIKQVQNLEIS